MKTKAKPAREEVLKEFPPVGKYRIRLLLDPKKKDQKPTLDIREYVSSESFEGYTRRGIRLHDPAQAELLIDILKQVLEGPWK